MKVWKYNRSGKLVVAHEVDSMDQARAQAQEWNRDEAREDMRIDIIQNAADAREATKVCAVYTVKRTEQGELFS